MAHPSDRWVQEEITQVEKFLKQGLSASVIATKLGRTRCSVLGIIHRRKLKRPGVPSITRLPPGPKPKLHVQKAPQTTVRAPPPPKAPTPPPPPQRISTASLVAALPPPKTLDDVHYGLTCAFPVHADGASTLYCCAATEGETYCLLHRRTMYLPQPKKRRYA